MTPSGAPFAPIISEAATDGLGAVENTNPTGAFSGGTRPAAPGGNDTRGLPDTAT